MLKTSETTTAVWSAVVEARGVTSAPEKSGTARLGGSTSYRYSTVEDLMRVSVGPLAAFGCALIQYLEGDFRAGTAMVHTRITHAKSGEFIECSIPALPSGTTRASHPMQDLGASYTYASRYSLSYMMCLPGGLCDVDRDCQEEENQRKPVTRTPAAVPDAVRQKVRDGAGQIPRPEQGEQSSTVYSRFQNQVAHLRAENADNAAASIRGSRQLSDGEKDDLLAQVARVASGADEEGYRA